MRLEERTSWISKDGRRGTGRRYTRGDRVILKYLKNLKTSMGKPSCCFCVFLSILQCFPGCDATPHSHSGHAKMVVFSVFFLWGCFAFDFLTRVSLWSQARLKLDIWPRLPTLLPQLPKYCNYRHTLPHLAPNVSMEI